MKSYHLFFASALLVGTVGAQAQGGAKTPWYVTAIVGAVNQSSQTLDYRPGGTPTQADASYNAGLLAGAALGYDFGNGWRAEGEFSYQSTDLKGNPFAGTAGPTGNGNHAATAVALNVFREFDLVGRPTVRTYAGLGLVYLTEVDIDFEPPGQAERSFSGSGTGVQFLLGARYDLGQRWFVDAGLRYLLANKVEMDSENGGADRIDARFRPWGLAASVGWRF
jgi:outer membrane immunogenic protein